MVSVPNSNNSDFGLLGATGPSGSVNSTVDDLFRIHPLDEIEKILAIQRTDLATKRNELRDLVRDHYRDLIDTSDHAVAIARHCSGLQSSTWSLTHHSRELQLLASTIPLEKPAVDAKSSGPCSPRLDHLRTQCNAIEASDHMRRAISDFDFAKANYLIQSDRLPNPHAQSPPVQLSRNGSANFPVLSSPNWRLLFSLCEESMASIQLSSVVQGCACLEAMLFLAKQLGDGLAELVPTLFWKQRTALLDQLVGVRAGERPPVEAIGYALAALETTVAIADQAQIENCSEFKSFTSRFGGSSGKLAQLVTRLLDSAPLGQLEDLAGSLRSLTVQHRSSQLPAAVAPAEDMLAVVEGRILDAARTAVDRFMEGVVVRLDDPHLSVSEINEALDQIVAQVGHFGLWSPRDALGHVTASLEQLLARSCTSASDLLTSEHVSTHAALTIASNAALLTRDESVVEGAVVSADLADLHAGLSMGSGVREGVHWTPHLSHVLRSHAGQLTALVSSALTIWARQSACDQLDLHGWASSPWGMAIVGGDAIAVPVVASAALCDALRSAARELHRLPVGLQEEATLAMKAQLAERVVLAVGKARVDLQLLFDCGFARICLSCPAHLASAAYRELSESLYSRVESECLSDPVDRALFQPLLRQSTLAHAVSSLHLLGPLFTRANPLFAMGRDEAAMIPFTHPSAPPVAPVAPRLPTLPVSASAHRRPPPTPAKPSPPGAVSSSLASALPSLLTPAVSSSAQASLQAGQAAISAGVTSFLNQVRIGGANISLGSSTGGITASRRTSSSTTGNNPPPPA